MYIHLGCASETCILLLYIARRVLFRSYKYTFTVIVDAPHNLPRKNANLFYGKCTRVRKRKLSSPRAHSFGILDDLRLYYYISLHCQRKTFIFSFFFYFLADCCILYYFFFLFFFFLRKNSRKCETDVGEFK